MNRVKIFITLFMLLVTVTVSASSFDEQVSIKDINNFWLAFDQIIKERDVQKQEALLKSLYINKGSVGLKKMMQVRNYTVQQYINLINTYPKFWQSVRPNTLKAASLSKELREVIVKLQSVYPSLKPAKIFFTIGAMRSGGTTQGSNVLIGSELAMTDENTDISEFSGGLKNWLQKYITTNPIDGIVLLNAHEYVHTQQNSISDELLYQVLYEGVAEFVSVLAMGVPSETPAVDFGLKNPLVGQTFEKEMFSAETGQWLWGDEHKDLGMRDLGYYVGYAIAEKYYQQSSNKPLAIKTLIELDYTDYKSVNSLIDGTHYFSKPISQLKNEYLQKIPEVTSIGPFTNGQQNVDPKTNQLTIHFSKPMAHNRNFDYGPLGESAVVRFKKEVGYFNNDQKYIFEIEKLEPNKRYQITIGPKFRSKEGVFLKPYLIDFKTGE